ncbi:hypothetical protein ACFL6H_07580 [Candidatus Latescibacterota bacterium]
MQSDISVFNKGSIMPSIIELETGLQESENETRKIAEEKILQANLTGKKLIDDTQKELSLIEDNERKKLSEEVDDRTEKLKDDEDLKLQELKRTIEKKRKKALHFILKTVIPGWDGHFPE